MSLLEEQALVRRVEGAVGGQRARAKDRLALLKQNRER